MCSLHGFYCMIFIVYSESEAQEAFVKSYVAIAPER